MRQFPFTPAEFQSIYERVPRLSTDAVLVHPDGVILVERGHSAWQGKWHTPGGSVYYLEPVEQALQRIVHEEIGISFTVNRLLNYVEYDEVKERGFGYAVSLTFLCETTDTYPNINQDGEHIQAFQSIPENMIEVQQETIQLGLDHWKKVYL